MQRGNPIPLCGGLYSVFTSYKMRNKEAEAKTSIAMENLRQIIQYNVQPSPSKAAATTELTLPLTFLDIQWIHFHPIRRLLFYETSHSEEYFVETVLPELKLSLSITLEHYLPLAGKLLYPADINEKPFLRYVPGDSVLLSAAVSAANFDELTGNHARDADQFYEFVPQIPPLTDEGEFKVSSVFALQVTLFPGRGLCIGFANHHCVGDGTAMAGFIKAWALTNKLAGNGEFLAPHGESLPLFDRSVIRDPLGIDTIFWKKLGKIPLESTTFPLPTNRVRATYTLRDLDIKKLKGLVPKFQISSFVATAAYVWTCLAKSAVAIGEEMDEEIPDYFFFPVDARRRVDPPIPDNYFGNCLGFGLARLELKQLVREEGFAVAAEAICEDIKNRVNKKGELMKGMENMFETFEALMAKGMRTLSVSGSPRFDLYGVDFGWGKAKKVEIVSIDGDDYAMAPVKARDSDGLEIGLSLPVEKMKAFREIFEEGLKF